MDKQKPKDMGSDLPIENIGESQEQKFSEKVWDTFNRILDKFLGRNPKDTELREFMENENNLYDKNGNLTEAYKQHIKEMEDFVSSNSVDEDIKDLLVNDEIDDEMYSTIIDFVNRRQDIIQEFTREQRKKKDSFNPDTFIFNLVNENTSSEEERKQLLEAIDNLAQEDTLNALDDQQVSNLFKDIINKNNTNN